MIFYSSSLVDAAKWYFNLKKLKNQELNELMIKRKQMDHQIKEQNEVRNEYLSSFRRQLASVAVMR